nr:unnamed protein product [Spirometra erinaceieuropaei]
MQLRWSGHLVRMDGERLPKRLFYGDVATGHLRINCASRTAPNVFTPSASSSSSPPPTNSDSSSEPPLPSSFSSSSSSSSSTAPSSSSSFPSPVFPPPLPQRRPLWRPSRTPAPHTHHPCNLSLQM